MSLRVRAGRVRHLAQDLGRAQGDLRPDVRQPAVAGDEDQLVARQPLHAKHPDVDPVLQVLVAQLIGDGPVVAHRADGVVLPDGRDQAALGGHGRDPAKHRLVLVLQLDQDELAVHGDRLELVAVREHQVGVELHAAGGEAAEDADDGARVEEPHHP